VGPLTEVRPIVGFRSPRRSVVVIEVRYNHIMRRRARPTTTPAGDLRAASRSGALVSVASRLRGVDPVEGLIVLVGLRWAVVHRLRRDMVLDGYVAVPTLQVAAVVDLTHRDWRAGAVKRMAPERPVPPHVDPTTTTTLLRSASSEFGVLAVTSRRPRTVTPTTGEIERMVGRQLVFTPLRAGSTVEACPLQLISIPEISCIEFGSLFASALANARGHRAPTELAVGELRGLDAGDPGDVGRRPHRPTAVA
jgi:hypothetical protein